MVPVAVYLVAIATMAVLAANVGVPGGRGRSRPVRRVRHACSPSTGSSGRCATADAAVHVTYHLAQGLLVLSLLR